MKKSKFIIILILVVILIMENFVYATIEEINSDSLNNEESEEIKTETQEMNQAEGTNIIENDELQENNTEQNSNEDKEIDEVTITVTIIEKEKIQNTIDANAINLEKAFKEQTSTKKITNSSSSSIASSKSKNNSNNTEETYKGSSNKYLSNIEVEGYQLTPNFNTTNTTYFLEVESSVTKLNITTEKYDDSEIVTIYGNDDLKTGINKILINVTAEDGTTKTYRIYVTKK